MFDFSNWKERREKVTNLFLDPLNPRFTGHKDRSTQNELINEMIEKYKIYDLAKSIAVDGFFPDKKLIAIIQAGKLYIVEGNRRITALKCLLNNDIIAGKDKNKFAKLSASINKGFIQKVTIVISPSREAANPIIFKEHTGSTVMPWSTIMQAEFYMRQINNGISIEELEEEYHRPRSEINSFLKLYYMYDIAQRIDYKDEDTREKIEDKQSFPGSTLERIINSTTMKEFLGISFDDKANIIGKRDIEEFKKAYTKIITDIVNKEIHSRSLNKEEDIQKYTSTLAKYKPRKKGVFKYDDFISKLHKKELHPIAKPAKKPVHKPRGIIPPGMEFGLKASSSLQKNFSELKRLPVRSYPNTTAAMLRIFLDKTLRKYLKKLKIKTIPVKRSGKEKQVGLADAKLGEIIDYLIKKDVVIIDDKNIKRVLKKFKNPPKQDSLVSLETLNAVVHNEELSLTEQEVRDMWPNLEGLFEVILTDPPATVKK